MNELADLHRHLDGSLRLDTLRELADRHGIEVPDDLGFRPGMTLDEALASNVHTSAIGRLEDHPLTEWLRRGVHATVCTDNTLFSHVDAPTELDNARSISGMTDAFMTPVIPTGCDAAFER